MIRRESVVTSMSAGRLYLSKAMIWGIASPITSYKKQGRKQRI